MAGIKAILPAGAATKPGAEEGPVSCASAGNCSTGGAYFDSSGHVQLALVTETAGTWKPAVKAKLPAGASGTFVSLGSMSCAAPGDCSAVGFYLDSSKHEQGLLLTETAGTWGQGVKAPLPADAGSDPKVILPSVSCTSPGNCSAVGGYTDGSGHGQGLLLTQAAGGWTAVEEATLPNGHGTGTKAAAFASSVSCTSPGNCEAVGAYKDSSGNTQGMFLTESAGFWAQADKMTPPAGAGSDPQVRLSRISCRSAGNCEAIGDYKDSSDIGHVLVVSESSDTWAGAKTPPLPSGAATGANAGGDLFSLSCPSAGNCAAVGYYLDTDGNGQGLLLSGSSGTWTATKAALPAGAGSAPNADVTSVSCPSAGNCGAVGNYNDSSGNEQPLFLVETAGAWSRGVKALLPADAASKNGIAFGNEVSCPSPGNCGAAGGYNDSSGRGQGLLLSSLHRLTVSKSGPGRGAVTSSPAGISCGTRCSGGFANGRFVTLRARPARGSWFTRWSGPCKGRGACRVQMITERSVKAHFALLPNTKITKATIDAANHRARFKFKALGKAKGFQCALVKRKKHKKPKPHFSRCHSPKTFKGLAPGHYSFLVRAFNAGGPDPTPAKMRFRL